VKTGILEGLRERGLESLARGRPRIAVGMATCGVATGAQEVYDELTAAIAEARLDAVLTRTGCLGFCQKEPLVDLFLPGFPRLTYAEMTPEKARELVVLLGSGRVLKDNLLCRFDTETLLDDEFSRYDTSKAGKDLEGIPAYHEVPFFAKQRKIALRNCGFIDPDSIEEYVARGGYFSLLKVVTGMSPEQTIDEVKQSCLRGRGGAGFLTGRKWELCRSSKGDAKYLVCNADEGDPGAYMDRSVLEGDPHSVVEGMLIGAHAVGANAGFIYVRTEYPLARERMANALAVARKHGLLAGDILGSGLSFDIEIREGSGAFVCGEETSLMHSIEGLSPEPRQRPPFPTEQGLWGCPTNINNVETWASVPAILAKGSKWYSSIGTEKSAGTKVFSLVGKVRNTGLVEVPMGMTLREIVFDIGGGVIGDKRLKAVQTGGPSGGCVPEALMDLPVDYERLAEAGSIVGSGGMVVMDEDTCIVDIAKYFLAFTNDESCGKCTSCREGSEAMLEVLGRITAGKGEPGDIEFLQELGEAVKDASQCGLGQTLPNPLLSTLRYFSAEYEEHIARHRCPAGVCRALITYGINPEKCTGCGLCRKHCPASAVTGEAKQSHRIDAAKCTRCGVCRDVCKFCAVEVE
jgi:NADH:ubiquinone oxidoreductase subunit F (NADH-binding)/(2Fe-2S) ferredoxin/Pyruvate/2-oxoacid:ferredoxin oxidoreductase delta subunit